MANNNNLSLLSQMFKIFAFCWMIDYENRKSDYYFDFSFKS